MARTKKSHPSEVRTVIGYVRVSTEKQVESGAGLDAQRNAIASECARRGWTVSETALDEGYSGKSLDRPGLREVLDRLSRGEADALVVAKLDRLSRSAKDFAEVVDMARHYGWKLIVLDCNVDTSTPAGEMLVGVMAQFAQFERRMIGVRTREALAVKKAQGVILGRPVVMGRPVEDRILDLRASGLSMAKIADRLNGEGVEPVAGGSAWYASTVSRVLSRRQEATA